MIKKSNRFIALMLVVFICNVYSMKRAHEEEKARIIPAGSRIILSTGGWVETVGDILLDEANIKDLVHFTDLPPEILERIIYLLSANAATQSLEDVAKNINTLVLVNKDLDQLINNPSFCLHLIKHLSKKFKCTDEEAAEALYTKEAQRRLELQEKLYDECMIRDQFSIEAVEKLLEDGADINFIYSSVILGGELLMSVYREGNAQIPVIQWLVEHGANEDQQNHLLLYITEYFCDYGDFIEYAIEIVKILLSSKADPESRDENGHSILLLVQKALEERQKEHDAISRAGEENQYRRTVLSEDIETLKTAITLLQDAIQRKRKLGH